MVDVSLALTKTYHDIKICDFMKSTNRIELNKICQKWYFNEFISICSVMQNYWLEPYNLQGAIPAYTVLPYCVIYHSLISTFLTSLPRYSPTRVHATYSSIIPPIYPFRKRGKQRKLSLQTIYNIYGANTNLILYGDSWLLLHLHN